MKKYLALILAMVLCLTLFAGCKSNEPTSTGSDTPDPADTGVAESDLQYILDKGKMTIGYTPYEPMNYVDDNGEFTGFDTEFAKAVCEKLGVEPDFTDIIWDTKVIELEAKSIDCVWNGMTITDELKANIAISTPYVNNMQVVVIKADNADKFKDVVSLSEADLVAEAGSAGETVIKEDAELSKANYVSVSKQTDALLEVKAGTADAAILDWTLAKSMIGEGTDYEDLIIMEGAELSGEEYGIGFRKDSDLCDKVNEIIEELKEDGTLQALADKYGLTLAE